MGVSRIKVYYSKVFWVLWVLRKTRCTFPAANQNTALLGAFAPTVTGAQGKSCLHPSAMPIDSPHRHGQLKFASSELATESPPVTSSQALQFPKLSVTPDEKGSPRRTEGSPAGSCHPS